MRIALIQDYLRMGGTERQTVALAHAFVAAGHEVLLVTFRPGGPLVEAVDERVLRIALQVVDLGLDWFSPGFVRVLRGFQPDVVQFMGRMANAQGWRVRLALPHVRTVATFRTGKSIPAPFRWTFRRAHAVVANSAQAARVLRERRLVDDARLHVIRNAVIVADPAPAVAREDIRRELGTPANAIVFLCVAMMRRGKGHADLIRAASEVQTDAPWEMWLAGDGVEFGRCLELAHRSRAQGHIRLLGLRKDVQRLYAAADVAILASRLESLPNFLVEAQWNGLPAVACDVAGVRETFIDGETGFLLQLCDTPGYARALERIAEDSAFRARASAAAREFARREFDPAQQNRRYLDLYASL